MDCWLEFSEADKVVGLFAPQDPSRGGWAGLALVIIAIGGVLSKRSERSRPPLQA